MLNNHSRSTLWFSHFIIINKLAFFCWGEHFTRVIMHRQRMDLFFLFFQYYFCYSTECMVCYNIELHYPITNIIFNLIISQTNHDEKSDFSNQPSNSKLQCNVYSIFSVCIYRQHSNVNVFTYVNITTSHIISVLNAITVISLYGVFY